MIRRFLRLGGTVNVVDTVSEISHLSANQPMNRSKLVYTVLSRTSCHPGRSLVPGNRGSAIWQRRARIANSRKPIEHWQLQHSLLSGTSFAY